MATYEELFDLRINTGLRNKIAVACVKKAESYITGSTDSTRLQWADNTISGPVSQADKIINYVLAANSNSSVSSILGATDSAIQSNVDTAVDALTAGGIS